MLKKEKKRASSYQKVRLNHRDQLKEIGKGTLLLSKSLDNYDCSVLTSFNHYLDLEINNKKFALLKYLALERGYSVFLVKVNLDKSRDIQEEVMDSALVLFDYKQLGTLEEDTKIWASRNSQKNAFFIPKVGRAKEVFSNADYSSFKKLKLVEKFISKILSSETKIEDAFIMEYHIPDTIMGKHYVSVALENLKKELRNI